MVGPKGGGIAPWPSPKYATELYVISSSQFYECLQYHNSSCARRVLVVRLLSARRAHVEPPSSCKRSITLTLLAQGRTYIQWSMGQCHTGACADLSRDWPRSADNL